MPQPDHTRIIELLAAQHEQGRTLIVSLLGAGAKWHTIATIAQFYSSLDDMVNNLGDSPHGSLQPLSGASLEVGYAQASIIDLQATVQELARLEKRLFTAIEEVEARTARLETGAGALNSLYDVAQHAREQAATTAIAQTERDASDS